MMVRRLHEIDDSGFWGLLAVAGSAGSRAPSWRCSRYVGPDPENRNSISFEAGRLLLAEGPGSLLQLPLSRTMRSPRSIVLIAI